MDKKVVVRGGGDLASGVILRLHRCGFKVLVTELEKPLVVRRTVAFAEAVNQTQVQVEEITGRRIFSMEEAGSCWENGIVPVMVDPEGTAFEAIGADVVVDGRMMKQEVVATLAQTPMVIGLGPGFLAGKNCHAVVETKRGPFLGRVIWKGMAEINSGIPEIVQGRGQERVLRAPASGKFRAIRQIGDFVDADDLLGDVNGYDVKAPFAGMVRGLIDNQVDVLKGMKIGDVDPRQDIRLVQLVSDKALAIGGGVLEAILTANGA